MLKINYLQDCICFNLKIGNKRCTIVSHNRSPSESANEFKSFWNNANLTLESVTQKNPVLAVLISGYNAKSSKWWTDDKTIQDGLKVENLLSQCALSRVINKLTYISQNFKLLFWSAFNKSTKFNYWLGSSSFTSF